MSQQVNQSATTDGQESAVLGNLAEIMEITAESMAKIYSEAASASKKQEKEAVSGNESGLSLASFSAVITAIRSQGFTLKSQSAPVPMIEAIRSPEKQISDEEFKLIVDFVEKRKSQQKDAEDGEPKTPGLVNKKSDDFEVDLDREQEVIYKEMLKEKQMQAKKAPNDSVLKKEIEQASSTVRKMSYDDYIKEGNSFDHLKLKDCGSVFRRVFEEAGVYKELPEEPKFLFSCKTGPSTLLMITDEKFYKLKKHSNTYKIKESFEKSLVSNVNISLAEIVFELKKEKDNKVEILIKEAEDLLIFLKKHWKEKIFFQTN